MGVWRVRGVVGSGFSAKRALLWVLVCAAAPAASPGVSSALARSPWWQLSSSAAPARLTPGGTGQIVVSAANLGDLAVSGAATPVSITDVLPPGVVASGIGRTEAGSIGSQARGAVRCSPAPPASAFPAAAVTCTWSEPLESGEALQPYELLEVAIDVQVGSGVSTGAENEVQVSGGEGYVCKKVEGAGEFSGGFCGANGALEKPTGQYDAELTGELGAPASIERPLTVGAGPTPFGVEEYTLTDESEGGATDTRAGSHPFQMTTSFTFNQASEAETEAGKPPGIPKDLHILWPPGLLGDPNVLAQCSESDFSKTTENGQNMCAPDTVVGVASLTAFFPQSRAGLQIVTVPLFNLVPGRGEPARFGFEAHNVAVTFDASVRSGRDYGITVSVDNITQAAVVISGRVTVWGVPGDGRHDGARGWSCVQGGAYAAEEDFTPCTPLGIAQPPPFLTLPGSCTGPLQTSVQANSWEQPGNVLTVAPAEAMGSLDGCNQLPFAAETAVAPDLQSASTATGLSVDVHAPQEGSTAAEGLAPAAVRNLTFTLPAGVTLNPAAGNDLEACSEGLVGFTGWEALGPGFEPGVSSCSDASKIGTVTIKTPLLPVADPLKGFVYLAAQNANPFGSLLAMYVVAEDPVSGVLVKLAGVVTVNQTTGQLTATFENMPQLPFEELELHFFSGERTLLATPSRCGRYETSASIAPWSGNAPVDSTSTFEISTGPKTVTEPNGSLCPGASLPFAPSLTGGTTNIQAGGFSPLTVTVSRVDGQQALQSLALHLPAGLLGMLSSVKPCGEAQANAGTCGPESEIGETTVSAGVGGDPVSLTGGRVYLTEPYEGAPFGLSIVNPVKVGPLDLEHDTSGGVGANSDPPCDCAVVRAKLEVDPHTAALTIATDASGSYAIPQIIDGVPLEIRDLNITIDGAGGHGFISNPTDCAPLAMTGTITGAEGASQTLTVPFRAANCTTLTFKPKLSASTQGKTSIAKGASLKVKLTFPTTGSAMATSTSSSPGSGASGSAGSGSATGGEANLKSLKIDLPKQLPSRLTTLQQACRVRTFDANPAACPGASKIGYAVVHTPLLGVPLSGPAIFVSHGDEAFPSMILVLQGDGVKIDLVGETNVENRVSSTTFKTLPDVPISTLELTLGEGPYSALDANGNLCEAKLAMPTALVGQNGAAIHESTKVTVTGCPKRKTRRAGKK